MRDSGTRVTWDLAEKQRITWDFLFLRCSYSGRASSFDLLAVSGVLMHNDNMINNAEHVDGGSGDPGAISAGGAK